MTRSIANLSVRIEDERGIQTPARVYLTDSTSNNPVYAKEVIIYDKKSRKNGVEEKHFVPPNGEFEVDLPPGNYDLVIERGKEYVPVHETIAMVSEKRSVTVRLRRWVDMRGRGWYSGDMHLHRPLRDVGALMKSEDLAVSIPVTRWKANETFQEDPDLGSFLALTDEDGTIRGDQDRFFPVVNEELEPRTSALIASYVGKSGVRLEYPLAQFGRTVGEAGGLSDSEKATSLELPALAALGSCQTVGLANNHLWRAGAFTGAWGAWPEHMLNRYPSSCESYVGAGFEMFAALLNMGFRLAPSAGSASGVHPVPPGWSRVYVHSKGPLEPKSWFDALKEGRCFVTTGPMLLLKVNGLEPGESERMNGTPIRLQVDLEILSLKPITTAEVVINGVPHQLTLTAKPGEPYATTGSENFDVGSSAWVAARWSQGDGGRCDAAHTGAVYFWNGDESIPVDIHQGRLLLGHVESLIELVKSDNTQWMGFPVQPETRDQALKDLERAREIYKQKVAWTATGRKG